MVLPIENVTGWTDLMQGHVVAAVYNSLNVPMGGWLIVIFYFLVMLILQARTQSWELPTIVGTIFLTVFLVAPTGVTDLNPAAFGVPQAGAAVLIYVFFLALSLFKTVAKEKSV